MSKELYDLLKEWFDNLGGVPELIKIEEIIYPTTQLVIQIHDFLIDHFPSNDKIHSGVLSEGNVDHAIYVMKLNENLKGENKILKKAATFMNYMFGGHAFVDGNKRTGFVVALLFITLNLDQSVVLINYLKNVKLFEEIASKGISEQNIEILKMVLSEGLKPINSLPTL